MIGEEFFADEINLNALLRVFDEMTNSYKIVYFQAVINLLTQPQRNNTVFSLREIAIEMLAIAYFPHTFFKLSFGARDQIAEILGRLSFTVEEAAIGNPKTQARLRVAIEQRFDEIGAGTLMRYVPFRFLAPFLSAELKGFADWQKKKAIVELAAQSFLSRSPTIYRFTPNAQSIELHPNWASFLKQSLGLINGWLTGKWIEYLQAKNPNTPAVSRKIKPPMQRTVLKMQTEHWQLAMRKTSIRCIYSGEKLNGARFSLDHFLPWSFVCHDQLWNLIPVLPEANSSKSNCLPSLSYVDDFIQTQCNGLVATQTAYTKQAWCKVTDSYISDLHVSQDKLLHPQHLEKAYQTTLPAMISLAQQTGFQTDWVFRS